MHNTRIELSVVVPMYNAEKYITECLDSVINQDLDKDKYEIIVVNDGSHDAGPSIVKSYVKDNNFIKMISQENHGLSVARNTGINNACGDYVLFLDADDWLKENCFSEIIARCKDYNLDVLRISAANVIDGTIHKRYNLDSSLVVEGKDFFNNETEVCAPFSICKRELLNKFELRFFPGIFHEDGEFTPRLYYYAKRVGFVDDIFYFVRQTPNSITRSINIKKPLDLLVVMRRLHDFSLSIENAPAYLDDKISSAMNQSMTQGLVMPRDCQRKINDEIAKNKDLYFHLCKSKLLKYRIEGYLLRLFPNAPLTVFKLLRLIH